MGILPPPPQGSLRTADDSRRFDWLFKLYKSITGYAPYHAGPTFPTAGDWNLGDIIWNNAPAGSGYIGWTCITAGNPGIWKGFGLIEA